MRFNPGTTALTILGWTPGLQVTGGRVLACGCFVGLYAARSGDAVLIIDAAGDSCCDPRHRVNCVLDSKCGDPQHGSREHCSLDHARHRQE
jgi:hypothetical protein